jgi:F-type H+-transporting ATPase subunit delta
MPARSAAAKRYAQAVFALASDGGQFEAWQRDLTAAEAIVADDRAAALLESPRLAPAQRAKIIKQALPGLSPLALNLVQMLVAKGRVRLLPDIAAAYQELLDEHRGIQHATVTSAVPLEPAVRDRLTRALAERTGKTIVLEARVDPAIVGGLIVRVGDRIIDGSTRSKLAGLRQALAGRPV